MRTDNLAIVFIDIAGFTPRTAGQSREENQAMLRRFADVVKPVVRAYDGKVVKAIGDAYLLTFRSPTDAVLCSTAVHDRLQETNAQVDETDRFDIRAAVNVGEVRVERGDVFGEAVNIAARIEGQTKPGEVYFSEAVYLAMTRSEVPAEDLGYVALKGIRDKVRLYRVPQAGDGGAYALEPRGDATEGDAGTGDAEANRHSLAPARLPFAGLGLNPVREKLQGPAGAMPVLAPHISAAQGWLSALPDRLAVMASAAQRFIARWRVEVTRSRRWQIGTVVAAIAVLSLLAGGIWRAVAEKPKPLTPWEKVQRRLGL